MNGVFAAVVILLATVVYSNAQQCPQGWKEHQDQCYYIVTTDKDWWEAEHLCALMKPERYGVVHLLAVENPTQMAFLQTTLQQDPNWREKNYWTSGNNLDTRVSWQWMKNRNKLSYSAWHPGQPDGSGRCLMLWGERDFFGNPRNYLWDDSDCHSGQKFICQGAKADLQ